ncbi:hypothetical protein BDV12DRAFT_206337 [Aspergillus spectabilis]
MASPFGNHLLADITKRRTARSARISSWDQKGLNEDAFVVLPGKTAVLADLEGPGAITHLWFVQTCRKILGPGLIPYSKSGIAVMEIHNALGLNYEVSDPDYYRKVLIKMYWDNSETPNVLAPIGDFFCLGHSMAANFQSLPFTVSVKPSEEKKFGGAAAFNCYLTMPFNKRARIEIENQNDEAYIYLETQVKNLDGKENYTILETEGAGHYIGCNHSIAHFQGTWWGEGDDMIFIDDDTWPPSMHGTGGEDYFSQGWGMQKNAYPFCGTIIHEEDVPNYQVSYRWHLADPVRFSKKIKVTLESGHANHLRDDWSTTAYWYQTLPGPKLEILPVAQRLPRKPEFPPASDCGEREKLVQHQERYRAFVEDRNQWLARRARDSKERALSNVEICRNIRTRFLESLNGKNFGTLGQLVLGS